MARWTVAVYGSCVSRDLVPYLSDHPVVMGYVARQSLISAMTAPVEGAPLPDLASSFQRRMVTGDLTSDATRQLRACLRARFLLLDITDERFGVLDLGDNRYITPSHEFRNAGQEFADHFAHGRAIPFGSDEHFELWATAVGRFMRFLRQTGLKTKTRLLAPAFAATTPDGEAIPSFMDRPADQWNALYERYIHHLKRRGLVTLQLSEAEAFGDVNHQWGLAPYHYGDPSSRLLASRVTASLRRWRERTPSAPDG